MEGLEAQTEAPADLLDEFELVGLLHGPNDFEDVSLVAASQEQVGFIKYDPAHPAQSRTPLSRMDMLSTWSSDAVLQSATREAALLLV